MSEPTAPPPAGVGAHEAQVEHEAPEAPHSPPAAGASERAKESLHGAGRERAVRGGFVAQRVPQLRNLYETVLDAGACANRRELAFHLLNRTIAVTHYDRAALWLRRGNAWRCAGVSGGYELDQCGEIATHWRAILTTLREPARPHRLTRPNDQDAAQAWDALAAPLGGLSVLWLPLLNHRDELVGGLWLERWGARRFEPEELAALAPLARGYSLAWQAVVGRRRSLLARITTQRAALLAGVALAFALVFVQLPIRVVAPCEVVPAEPVLVAAPLAGVIESVHVLPGRAVAEGELLASYDRRVADQELRIAEQQVAIAEAELQRARMQAFDDPRARAQLALLENRLAQEQTRLEIASERVRRLEIRAPRAGTVVLSDPAAWRGRPVQIGERILQIVDPERTKLRIWLPAADHLEFDHELAATIVLSADPAAERRARLTYVANAGEPDETGATRYRAEADWLAPPADLKLGARGDAILRGPRVSLGYWLIRKPLATLRRWTGV